MDLELIGVQRPLPPYRLPELVASGQQDVHVCEGEKDADRLAKLGLISTSIDTPSETDLSVFHARAVFIHEDNDTAGRDKVPSSPLRSMDRCAGRHRPLP